MTFEEFAADRLPGVLRFAAVVTGDRALAEDLAHEVLIRAHARWRKIGSLDRPEYYVRKMILNEFLHWRRREWRLIPSGAGSDVDHRSAPDHALGVLRAGRVRVFDCRQNGRKTPVQVQSRGRQVTVSARNLQEVLDRSGNIVELLRSSQIGTYIYPVVRPSSPTGGASSVPGARRPSCSTSPTIW